MVQKKGIHLEAFLPNQGQELLLKAALTENEEALAFWRDYLRLQSFDDTDYGSSRILPLVYRNLHRLGLDDPYMGRMKGIYRRTWAENQKNFRHIPGVFQKFHQAGIPALLLKGSALILLCYRDFGLRGMGDFDIAVPVSRVHEAVSILETMHWRTCLEYPKLQIELHHAVHLQSAGSEDLDLHWHILAQRCAEEYDQAFWEGARPLEYQGARILSLQPSDHLLHACVHGAAWSPTSPLRWIADAFFLVKNCEIDWERILEMGKVLGVIPALQATLPYLKNRFAVAVPDDFLSRLTAVKNPSWQYRELQSLCRPQGFFGILPILWGRYSRRKMEKVAKSKGSFPAYLKTFYGLDGYRELGGYFLKKAWKKFILRFRVKSGRSTEFVGME